MAVVDIGSFYFVGLALLTPQPSSLGDTDAIDGALLASSFGAMLAMISLVLTVGAVGAAWLRPWWLAIPCTLLVIALVRYHLVPHF